MRPCAGQAKPWWPHIPQVSAVSTELIFGNCGHVHKPTIGSFSSQQWDLPPGARPACSPSILRCLAGVRRRSRSCSSRPVHLSMPPLRVSGAGLQHRPPLSSPLRTFIHAQLRGSYLQQHTHTQTVCVLNQTPPGSKKTHFLRSFADSVQ